MIVQRKCQICGKEFMGHPQQLYCKDCKEKSLQINNREQYLRGTKRKLGSIDVCQRCGKEYVVNSGKQKYCPDCRKEVVHKRNIECQQRFKDRHPKAKKAPVKKTCAYCGVEFLDDSSTKMRTLCSEECRKAQNTYVQVRYLYVRGKLTKARWEAEKEKREQVRKQKSPEH